MDALGLLHCLQDCSASLNFVTYDTESFTGLTDECDQEMGSGPKVWAAAPRWATSALQGATLIIESQFEMTHKYA